MRENEMVFLWRIPDAYPENLIGEYDRKNSPDRFLFKKTEYFCNETGTPTIDFRKGTLAELSKFSCLASNAMVPIVDARLSEAIKKLARDDVQFVDVLVRAKDGESSDYKILNALHKVKAVDHKNSEYSIIPGTDQIMGFRLLRYTEGCLGEHDIARDAEYSSHLIVSERLRSALVLLNLPGLEFLWPEEIVW